MSDIDDVVTALASRLTTGMAGTLIGGRIFAYAPDSLNPPTAIVLPSSGDFVSYDVSMDGSDDFELVVKILIGSQDDRTGQAELLGYLARSGSTSLRTVIYADKTLGGTVSDLKVTGARAYGDVEWAGLVFFGAELVVVAYK